MVNYKKILNEMSIDEFALHYCIYIVCRRRREFCGDEAKPPTGIDRPENPNWAFRVHSLIDKGSDKAELMSAGVFLIAFSDISNWLRDLKTIMIDHDLATRYLEVEIKMESLENG